jgi:hypothetical protein
MKMKMKVNYGWMFWHMSQRGSGLQAVDTDNIQRMQKEGIFNQKKSR